MKGYIVDAVIQHGAPTSTKPPQSMPSGVRMAKSLAFLARTDASKAIIATDARSTTTTTTAVHRTTQTEIRFRGPFDVMVRLLVG